METLETSVSDIEWLHIEDVSAPGRLRGSVTTLSRRLGFSENRISEIAIAATELGTNLQRHAQEGIVLVRVRRAGIQAGVELLAIDAGPGVPDFENLATDGNSSKTTLGIGVGAIMRLASSFAVHSVPGRGTVMSVTFWNEGIHMPANPALIGGLTRPISRESICGDAWSQRRTETKQIVILADGLGHGELAATASREAVEAFECGLSVDPIRILSELDTLLRGTRGAAIAVVALDVFTRNLQFAGVGNVAVWIDGGQNRKSLISSPGIVGNRAKIGRMVEMNVPAGSLIVVHSDGVRSKWDLQAYAGLRTRNPDLIAATLLRDAGICHDDASVAVMKVP